MSLLPKCEVPDGKRELKKKKKLARGAEPITKIPEDRRQQAPPRCHFGCPWHVLGEELCGALCGKSRPCHLPPPVLDFKGIK